MKRMRLALVAVALCLVVIWPLAGPAYAWGGTGQYQCANQYSCSNQYPYPYQYANRYPNQYPYQYGNRYPYAYQYPNRYPYGVPVPPPPPPPPPPPAPPVYYVPRLTTAYGDYTRCAQYGLHQAECFVPDASNSPNLGSIQMEPGIQIWGYCTAGQTMTLSSKYQCSKTGAGWFPV